MLDYTEKEHYYSQLLIMKIDDIYGVIMANYHPFIDYFLSESISHRSTLALH